MADMEKVIKGLENLRENIRTATQYTFTSGGICAMNIKRIDNAIVLLKEQDERIKELELEKGWDESPDMMGKW